MSESEEQRLFAKLVGQLITWAYDNGLELTFGEVWRTPEQAALNAQKGIGIANSLHTERLAVDFNIWVNGSYTQDIQYYRKLGEYWKTLNSLACWGGDFTHPDPDHYSLAYGGRE